MDGDSSAARPPGSSTSAAAHLDSIGFVDGGRRSYSAHESHTSAKITPFELSDVVVTDAGGTGGGDADPEEPPPSGGARRRRPWRRPAFPERTKLKLVPLVKKATAEFIGTFVLIFTMLSTIVLDAQDAGVEGLLGVAASIGLAVAVLIMSLVHVSGCHINPAVSVAMAAFGHLPPAHLLPYVAAQVLGAVAASFAVEGIHHPVSRSWIVTVPKVGTVEAFFLEFVTTFVLLFVITALAIDPNAVKELIAVAVGGTVMMNVLVAGPSTGASMNPARTLGPAIATGNYTQIWVYMISTPLGALAGTGAYVAIKL